MIEENVNTAIKNVLSLTKNNKIKINLSKKLYLEEMNIIQQMKEISQCNLLIGVHGAGLTHLLFLPKNSAIIEINNVHRPHFKHLTHFIGYKYYQIDAHGDPVKVNYNDLIQNVQNALNYLISKI